MAKPNLEPGIYKVKKGKKEILFAYRGKDSEGDLTTHPYFNVHVHFPNGEKAGEWYMEQSAFISRPKRLEPEEIKERIANLSQGSVAGVGARLDL